MKTAKQWFDEYGVSHQNGTNKTIHFICVPAIMFSLLGLLSAIPDHYFQSWVSEIWQPYLGWHTFLIVLALIFYFRLSTSLGLGMLVISALWLYIIKWMNMQDLPVGWVSFFIFVAAWIGQFIGHKIEGQKPSFFQDVQFLLIGPIWILGFIYKKWNINY